MEADWPPGGVSRQSCLEAHWPGSGFTLLFDEGPGGALAVPDELERYGVGTRGSGGPGQAKVHGHPVIPWDRVVRVGSEIVVRDESDQQTTMDFT